MEGGQKININLESPLDTKSSDMLVPVNEVKFAHNRQKYQGHVLPNSLRYERNGWAAGWYVYDFKMGGGYIFSRNRSGGIYLAADRSKLNNTPTYVISFHTASNNDITDPDAVSSAVQFQAWYTETASINARECKEASIDNDVQPVLSFNYAIDNHDYKRKLKFNWDPVLNTTTFTQINDPNYGNADLTIEYKDRAADGTVTALLTNNVIHWEYSDALYIPKDLIDADGFKFGKFTGVTNGVITWKLGDQDITFDNATTKFTYNETQHNPGDDVGITYSIPFTYTIPMHKYYSALNDIAWSIQGTSRLFSSESDDTLTNRYRMSLDHISSADVNIYDHTLSGGISGPDISLVSEAEFDLKGVINDIQDDPVSNVHLKTDIPVFTDNAATYVPIATAHSLNFRLPGEDEDKVRDVTIQLYYKYEDGPVPVGVLDGRRCFVYVIKYDFANMARAREPERMDGTLDYGPYRIDGKTVETATDYDMPANPGLDDVHIASRSIVGHKFTFEGNLKNINDIGYSDDNAVNIKFDGVACNIVFSRATAGNEWVSEEVSTGSRPTRDDSAHDFTGIDYKHLIKVNMDWQDYHLGQGHGDSGSQTWYLGIDEDYVNDPSKWYTTNPDYYNNKPVSGLVFYDANDTVVAVPEADTLEVNAHSFTSKIAFKTSGMYIDEHYEIHDTFIDADKEVYFLVKRVYRQASDKWFIVPLSYFKASTPELDVHFSTTNSYSWTDNSNIQVDFDVFKIDFAGSVQVSHARSLCSINHLPVRSSEDTISFKTAVLINNSVYGLRIDDTITTETDAMTIAALTPQHFVYPTLIADLMRVGPIRPGGSLPNAQFDWNHSIDIPSNFIITTTNSGISIYHIEVDNDILYVYWYDGYRIYKDYYDYKLVNDYWLSIYQGGPNVLDITTQFSDKFRFDVVDNTTGEVLIDHRVDTLGFDGVPSLKFVFDRDSLKKGKLFFNNSTDPDLMETYAANETLYNMTSVTSTTMRGNSNIAEAFFPVTKYQDESKSIFDWDNRAGIQGIAVFNMDGAFLMSVLSPIYRYILPPRIIKNVLHVYAGKTYTHRISLESGYKKFNINQYDYYLIDDSMTDINSLYIRKRLTDEIFSSISVEDNNNYYTKESLLRPVAISYYDDRIHINYKPVAGHYTVINGNTYDLSASEISIKQEASLPATYVPEHIEDSTVRYHLVIGENDVLNVRETKDIISSIADVNKHWVSLQLNQLNFGNVIPKVSFYITEHHVDAANKTKIIQYNEGIPVISHSALQADYSDENQLVFASSVDGTATIHLPAMPTNKFVHDITPDEITVDATPVTGFTYEYKTGKVKDMHINNMTVSVANINLTGVNSDNQAYNVYNIEINQNINTYVYFKHFGIYKLLSKTIGDYTPEVSSITYDAGVFTLNVRDISVVNGMSTEAVSGSYQFNFNDYEDPEKCTPKYLVYTATDVRNGNTKEFARVMADNEYQLIKQHWDSTVATECFWWLDPNNTLELTKDRFIVKAKVQDSYHDWNGDNWETVKEYNRIDYLTSEADTYIVSSANGKNAKGYLYILQPVTATRIKVTIYDPLSDMQVVTTKYIEFKHVALGTVLNEGNSVDEDLITVCTYSDIVSNSLLTDSKLTAVNINGVPWLGIQYDKNFNQWSFALNGVVKIVHGYGCIGINGCATGGMLPDKYCDLAGFTDKVYSLSELEAEEGKTLKDIYELNTFNERIVGDENQQWYVAEKLENIVMAIDLINNKKITLPITNKYTQVYSSPSYAKYTVHALGIQIKQLVNLFTDEKNPIWLDIIKYAMFPIVWYLSPYTNVINYLQQTLGQYAYTHFNSTSISRKSSKLHDEVNTDNAGLTEDEAGSHIDTLVSDDLSFDVIHIPQEQSFKDNSWDNILGIFASMVVSATEMSMRDVAVNSLQNQSAVNDIGKKFSQAFLQNIGSMSVTGFTMQSTKPMLKSEVTAVKTLDMFYSTSAEQNCFAGPGFVNMQFVAQCTAQSVTSVQLEAQQTQMFMLLKELTTWQGKAMIFLIDQLKDFMFKSSDNIAGQAAGVMPGVQSTFGWIAAMIFSASGYALVAAKAMTKLGIEVVDNMLTSFFPSGVKTTVTAQLSRHNYDIEGKHAYGNKSEQFFWPCADCKSKLYTDESVEAILQKKPWPLEMPTTTTGNMQMKEIYADQPDCTTETPGALNGTSWNIQVPYNIAMCKGSHRERALPDSTAYVIGTESFMPTVPFKNENIGEGEPVFTPPAVQDYIIDKNWNIFVTAMAGDALWVSCKDTKLFDGSYSNIVVTDDFCGIAAPHVAVEVKRNITEEYLRPWAVSPDAIALNITGLNCAYDEVAYHAFDGYGYRITDWLGAAGMNKERYTWQYCFQINDRFKRSNKLPPNQFMGNFQALPSMSLDVKDKVFNEVTVVTKEKGLRTGVAGENKDTQRYALPIFTEQISSLPAIVRALSPYKLAVIDGITSLTTDVRISQSVYKIPDSVDFNINDKLYRMTNEYICSVKHERGLEVVEYLVPALGLTYLGATPFIAYFYNQATRQYYIYQGGNTLQVMDMLERFRDIKSGIYDFINQEVIMPCLATFDRLNPKVKDDEDETDNIIIPVYRHNRVGGEITPPITTIFNTRSWYRTIATPAGLVFQGPNRCIINRFVWSQYMLEDIKNNKGKWIKVPREEYNPFRKYAEKYDSVNIKLDSKLKGWTHNPFLLVTSPIGVNEQTDCKFEWEITFAWTTEMDQIFEQNEYVTVNIAAETMCPGGKKTSRPTHVFLTKDLFTRTENVGYYSFRYQSNNGAGNRERLHIWSDGYIAVSSIQLEYKVITEKRTEKLTIQEDIKGMKEM